VASGEEKPSAVSDQLSAGISTSADVR